MLSQDSSHDLMSRLHAKWIREKSKTHPSLMRAFILSFGPQYCCFTAVSIVDFLFIAVTIYSIRFLVNYLEDEAAPWWHGLGVCVFFATVMFLQFFLR